MQGTYCTGRFVNQVQIRVIYVNNGLIGENLRTCCHEAAANWPWTGAQMSQGGSKGGNHSDVIGPWHQKSQRLDRTVFIME